MTGILNCRPGHTGYAFWILFFLVFASSSCSLKEIKEQTELADSGGFIEGTVKRQSNQYVNRIEVGLLLTDVL